MRLASVVLVALFIGSIVVIPAVGSLPIVKSLMDYPYEWTQSQNSGLQFQRLNPPYWDEYVTLQPPVTYIVRGTHFCLPESPGDCIQYPAFEWAWSGWSPSRASADVRACYYATTIPGTGGGPGWRMAAYDDGGERCKPLHGWMNVTLTIPVGTYTLALYAYDKESKPDGDPLARYSQEYRIYDQTGTTLLASKQISGTNFDNGVYEIFDIVAPTGGLTIIVQVYNDSGHYRARDPPVDSDNKRCPLRNIREQALLLIQDRVVLPGLEKTPLRKATGSVGAMEPMHTFYPTRQ